MPAAEKRLPTIWELPDDLWERVEPILARRYPLAATGRPRADLRRVLDGIIYRMRSGVQWNQLPRRFGADSTVHGWFQRLVADGVLAEIWAELVRECDELDAVAWEWQAADGVMGKSRFEGDARGPNPTDRAKSGTKKSVIVEQAGGPLGVAIAGANVHDTKLLAATIDANVIPTTTRQVRPAARRPGTSPTSGGSARRSSTRPARRPTRRGAGSSSAHSPGYRSAARS